MERCVHDAILPNESGWICFRCRHLLGKDEYKRGEWAWSDLHGVYLRVVKIDGVKHKSFIDRFGHQVLFEM